mmetsp:Transcript_24614/g.38020  ORF Transcript_24614/g.38020 Transcript_24614/m.38020 type:complete len:253 (+) Transcript_24614:1328-2086(+)
MTGGEEIISHAIERRFLSPPDTPLTLASPTIVSATFVRERVSMSSLTTSSRAAALNFRPSFNSTRNAKVSRTVICGKNVSSCFTNAAGSCESPERGAPFKYRIPVNEILLLSGTKPAIARHAVVFPAPLGPIIASILPDEALPRIEPSSKSLSGLPPFCFNLISIPSKSISQHFSKLRSSSSASTSLMSSSLSLFVSSCTSSAFARIPPPPLPVFRSFRRLAKKDLWQWTLLAASRSESVKSKMRGCIFAIL